MLWSIVPFLEKSSSKAFAIFEEGGLSISKHSISVRLRHDVFYYKSNGKDDHFGIG